jgi:hypothetical protein
MKCPFEMAVPAALHFFRRENQQLVPGWYQQAWTRLCMRPTMNSIVNMLLQHCSTVTTWNNMVDNLFIVGRTTLFTPGLSISTWNNLCVFSRVGGWFPWVAWNIELTIYKKINKNMKIYKIRLDCRKGNKKIRWFKNARSYITSKFQLILWFNIDLKAPL